MGCVCVCVAQPDSGWCVGMAEGHCGDNALDGVADSGRHLENRSFSNASGL